MTTNLEQAAFYRLKAAQHDLIVRAGGVERAGELCGYSKSHVSRWGSREHVELMPLAAVIVLERDTGAALVTQAMCAINGLAVHPAGAPASHLMGAYVAVAHAGADLAGAMADAVADGVITSTEQMAVDGKAAALSHDTENLRGALAAAGGKALKVVA